VPDMEFFKSTWSTWRKTRRGRILKTEIQNMLIDLEERSLQWFGHVERMDRCGTKDIRIII
jgi:hypothetical protein